MSFNAFKFTTFIVLIICNYASAQIANGTVESSTPKIYLQQPPQADHLAISILMILVPVVLLLAFCLLLKILHPWRRTKIAYMQLKRKRENLQMLNEDQSVQEFEMTIPTTSQTTTTQ